MRLLFQHIRHSRVRMISLSFTNDLPSLDTSGAYIPYTYICIYTSASVSFGNCICMMSLSLSIDLSPSALVSCSVSFFLACNLRLKGLSSCRKCTRIPIPYEAINKDDNHEMENGRREGKNAYKNRPLLTCNYRTHRVLTSHIVLCVYSISSVSFPLSMC